MNICIVIPNYDYLNQAGARIRYKRLQQYLLEYGCYMEFREIAELNVASELSHDIYIISKSYDVRCVVLANILKNNNKIVGVDLFDDYFSQYNDGRFARLRTWLSQLSDVADFAMCSTENMALAIQSYFTDKPIHILNDPYLTFNLDHVAAQLTDKLELLNKEKCIRVAWFGIGDNPNFDVGLKDLAKFGESLQLFKTLGYDIKLVILTNRRALTAENLILLNRLSIEFEIQEWSEQGEIELLENSLVSFIPVNAQRFSIVKSLNRAITAITNGTQVISPGYPLYESLSKYIYSSIESFSEAVQLNTFKNSPENLISLNDLLNDIASPNQEASKFVTFLEEQQNQSRAELGLSEFNCEEGYISVLHGLASGAESHKFIQKHRGFSVASPFSRAKINYDIRFYIDKKTLLLNVAVCHKTKPKLSECILPYLSKGEDWASRKYFNVSREFFSGIDTPCFNHQYSINVIEQPFDFLTVYSNIMACAIQMLDMLFEGGCVVISENSKLPWALKLNEKIEKDVSCVQ